MPPSDADQAEFVKESALYKEFLAERAEILKHKWIESEKAGKDIGFERALLDWIVKHRSNWRGRRRKEARTKQAASSFFFSFKAILGGLQGNRETKTESSRRRPDHGRGSNASRATPDCARDHRAKPAPRKSSARGDSVARRGDRAPNRGFHSRDRER